MVKINMREFSRHLAEYITRANEGEKFVIIKRNKPVAEIIPHETKKVKPKWSTVMPTIKLKNGLSASEELIKMRQEERY